jgi:hypothetical protein
VIKKVADVNLESLSRFMSSPRKDWKSCSQVDFPFDAIRAMEILLKHSPANRFVSFGRNAGGGSFFSKESLGELPGGLALHNGWYQNVKIADGRFVSPTSRPGFIYYLIFVGSSTMNLGFKLLMNLDVKNTAFYQSGPLVGLLVKFFNKRRPEDLQQVMGRDMDRRKVIH